MDIQKKREAFERLPEIEMGLQEYPDIKFEKDGYVYYGSNTITALAACYVGGAWMAWQLTKAQAVPEGFVLMPRICTNKMAHAAKAIDGRLSAFKYADVYKAMIEAQEPVNDSR